MQPSPKQIKNTKNATFNKIAIPHGINPISLKPPKNTILITNEMVSIVAYSPIKNIPHFKPLYSVIYPDTILASCSSKSNGILFVSAKLAIKNSKMPQVEKIQANQTQNLADSY